MTKRSVALVGVLILMVMVGSLVIGSFAGRAAPEEANGSSTLYLPLVMKLFAQLGATDIYMGGVVQSDSFSTDFHPRVDFAVPLGFSNTVTSVGTPIISIISPPQSCIAKDLKAEIIPWAATTLKTGYHLELTIGYAGGTESVNCLIDDPDITCVSSTQLTIPADSKMYLSIDTTTVTSPGMWYSVSFAWVCSPS